jgi:hypothetical protein
MYLVIYAPNACEEQFVHVNREGILIVIFVLAQSSKALWVPSSMIQYNNTISLWRI